MVRVNRLNLTGSAGGTEFELHLIQSHAIDTIIQTFRFQPCFVFFLWKINGMERKKTDVMEISVNPKNQCLSKKTNVMESSLDAMSDVTLLWCLAIWSAFFEAKV